MAKRLSLEAQLTLTDKMTAVITRAERKMLIFGRHMARAFPGAGQIAEKAMLGLNRQIDRFAKYAMIGGGALLAVGVKQAVDEYISFDNSLRQAGAKFKDLDVSAAGYNETLKQIGATARDVAAKTEFTATNTADALDKMAMAGFSSQLSMSLLAGTSDLATAAGTDLATAVGIAADTLGAFGLMSDDVGKTTTGLTRISDVFAKTVNTANTDLMGLFEGAKAGAPTFTAAGQSLVSFNAMMGVLANSGVKGEEAGTQIRNAVLRLADQTPEATKVLKQLGVTTRDGAGNFRDFFDILGDFEKGLKGYGTAQRTAALATIFGARSVTGINILLSKGIGELRKYRDVLDESTGASKKMADSMRLSLKNQIEVLKSGLVEVGLKFVEAFETRGSGALQKLIGKVQTFDVTPVINAADSALSGITSAFEFIVNHHKIILTVIAAVKGFALAKSGLGVLGQLTGASMAGALGPVSALVALFAAWVIYNKEIQEFFTWFDKTIAGPVGKFVDKFSMFGRSEEQATSYDAAGNYDPYESMYRDPNTPMVARSYSESVEKQRMDVFVRASQGAEVSPDGRKWSGKLPLSALAGGYQ